MENQVTPQHEVDLYEILQRVFNAIRNFFVSIFSWIFRIIGISAEYCFYFCIKHFIFLFISGILGLSIGYISSKTAKPYYESNLIARSNIVSNSDMINYINRLHYMAKEKDTISLAKVLKLDLLTTGSIQDIQAYWMIDENKDGIPDKIDYENKFDPDTLKPARRIDNKFYVNLTVYNNTIIDSIQNGLLYYINSSRHIQNLKNDKKIRIAELIKKTEKELVDLDSLKRFEYFYKEDQPVLKLNEILVQSTEKKEARLLYTNVLELYKEKQRLDMIYRLELEPITILEEFPPNQVAVNKTIRKMFISGVLFFFLAVSLILIRDNFRKILNIIQTAKSKV